jgi:hypothetical protein
LFQQFSRSLKTDVGLTEIPELARLAQEIDAKMIVSRSLEPPAVTPVTTQLGADILLPNRPEIAKVIRELFFDGHLRQEAASVEIVNASGSPALGSQVIQALQHRGITATASAAPVTHGNTS